MPAEPKPAIHIELSGAPAKVTENLISVTFHPIPLTLWSAILGFHRAVSIKYKGESVTYHRWNEKEKCYHTLIPYQQSTPGGLDVSTNWLDPRNVALLDAYGKEYGEDFLPCSTIHTHVDIAAFESGTDAKDEASMPGWHITLGKLLSYKEYDLDFRMRLPHTRRIKELVNTQNAIDLDWTNLFLVGTKKDSVFKCPGNEDFHHLLDRVEMESSFIRRAANVVTTVVGYKPPVVTPVLGNPINPQA